MGFGGRSDEEKARSGVIEQQATDISNVGKKSNKRANQLFKMFQKGAAPALHFWKDILEGDRDSISELLGPEISGIKNLYENEDIKRAEFTPRGGARASDSIALDTAEMSDIGNLITKARPTAAQNLTNMTLPFLGASSGFNQNAINALSQSSNILFGRNAEEEAVRQRRAQLTGSLAEGAGSVAGGIFGGK